MTISSKPVSANILYKVVDEKIYKLCSICEEYKPMNEENYSKNKTNKRDGFHPYCKPCNSRKSRQWEIDNPEKYKALNKTKLPSKNPVRLERLRTYRKTEKSKDYMTDWRNNNKDKIKTYNAYRLQHKTHEISHKEWEYCKTYFNNRCAYCGLHYNDHYRMYAGEPQKIDLHKEHVDHFGSNKIDNCVPSCLSCNSKKHNKELVSWYNEKNVNFTQYRIQRIYLWLAEDYKKIQ
jgi:hypothetical protein